MSLQEQKLSLIQGLLLVQDKSIIDQIDTLIKAALTSNTQKSTFLNFETWNKQFQDDQNMDTMLEDYGMTLGEFRKQIWQSEMDEMVELDDFFEIINL
jgi:hypothetical protein